jgi:hypothetical protein
LVANVLEQPHGFEEQQHEAYVFCLLDNGGSPPVRVMMTASQFEKWLEVHALEIALPAPVTS